MATARLDNTNEPFLKHLNVHKTPHIFLTAETDDFDEKLVSQWRSEGFVTHYVPLGNGGQAYTRKMKAMADEAIGLSDQYAIVGLFFSLFPL